MNIIEKLGIKQLESSFSKDHYEFMVPAHKVYEKEKVFNGMLEALINVGLENSDYTERHNKCRDAVEKATNKSWKEIKELLGLEAK